MTQAEFSKTRWGKGMRALYRGEIYLIAQVDFEEYLIGMVTERYESNPYETMSWARCENVELVNYQIPQSHE
jgi:predicted Mrr-cat superfamily restriction endonuclease